MRKLKMYCKECKKEYPFEFRLKCDSCNGPIAVKYDLSKVKIQNVENPVEKYYDLLPISSPDFIYHLGEGNTPLIHAKELGKEFGLANLHLKDEGRNPTNTTKDRMAAAALSYMASVDVYEFVAASTGNSATSMATYAAAFPEFSMHVFIALDFINAYRVNDCKNISTYVVESSYDEVCDIARDFAKKNNKKAIGSFFNVGRRAGVMMAVLEAYDQFKGSFDWLFQSTSSGMGILGSYEGIGQYIELGKAKHMPRIVCCNQDSCAPMVSAFKDNSPVLRDKDLVLDPSGICKSILRGTPKDTYPYLYRIVKETGGSFEKVALEDVLNTFEMANGLEGLDIGFSSAIALANVAKMAKEKRIKKEDKVLVNLTDGWIRGKPTKTTWKLYKA